MKEPKVRYSYLKEKFDKPIADAIWERMWSKVVSTGDYTIGSEVVEFENAFAKMLGCKHAIGVANGTDALRIALRMLDVGPGDEVITAANTFVASLGCIIELFAKPVLVDMARGYVMNPDLIERAITPRTKAIIPVHFTGEPVDMDKVMYIAQRYELAVVEDSCQSVLAEWKGKMCGTIGDAGAFSLHPLKNLNVWGDGGMITTNSDTLNRDIRLYRNHGMFDRDTITAPGCNSRLDSLQAAVGNYLIPNTPANVEQRRANAAYLDSKLKDKVTIIPRRPEAKSCFHLYMFEVGKRIRNEMVSYLNDHGIEAKIHYKTPLYLQPGLKYLGYKKGDFPEADYQSERYITIPCDEHIGKERMDFMIEKISDYLSAF